MWIYWKYFFKRNTNAELIKAPKIWWFDEQIGIWFPKWFIYKGEYENSICIGIIKYDGCRFVLVNNKGQESNLILGH